MIGSAASGRVQSAELGVAIPLPLHAHDLLEGVQDLGEVALVGHHPVDVLLGARDLVEDALVLAADDASGLGVEVSLDEMLLCGCAAGACSCTCRPVW
jgi:hypothetical protein